MEAVIPFALSIRQCHGLHAPGCLIEEIHACCRGVAAARSSTLSEIASSPRLAHVLDVAGSASLSPGRLLLRSISNFALAIAVLSPLALASGRRSARCPASVRAEDTDLVLLVQRDSGARKANLPTASRTYDMRLPSKAKRSESYGRVR